MVSEVGLGVVGLGAIADVHIGAIQRAAGARLAGVMSRSEAKARAAAERFDCAAFTDVEALVAHDDVDAIVICTPSGVHLEPARAAARAGKHVLVEKPLEVTVERCDAMIEACADAGVILAGVFQNRFYAGNRMAYEAARAGRFGRLVHAAAYVNWWRTQDYYDQADWRGTWALDGGGAVMNQAIHQIDLLQWIMGDVDSIFAFTDCLAHERLEVEDTAVAVLRFANGALGTIEAMTSAFPGYAKRLAIHGDAGGAVLEDNKIVSWRGKTIGEDEEAEVLQRFASDAGGGGSADPMAISHQGHDEQMADFVDAIRNGRSPSIPGQEARRAVAIAEALYRSAQSGKPVAVP